MPKLKAQRNKTIDTKKEEGAEYLRLCKRITEKTNREDVVDSVICQDFFSAAPLLPSGFADLIIADPPYNLTKSFGDFSFNKTGEAEYESYTRSWLELVSPLLSPKGSIYVCCDWSSSLIIGRVLGDYFKVRNRITWQREKGRGASSNWKNGMEDIWFATSSKDYTFNLESVKIRKKVIAPYRLMGKPKDWQETKAGKFRDTCPSNFWDDITVPFWSMSENTAHPTQKPEKLVAKLILASSNEGDMVFDPFLGSGTTCVSAKKLGRKFAGCEINEQYCIWAQQRLLRAESDKGIQGYEDGVFKERNAK